MKMINAVINGHNVTIAFDKDSIHIYNGYSIKDDLKVRGYRFNPGDKSWFINPINLERELEVLKNDMAEPETGSGEELSGKDAAEAVSSEFPSSYSIPELRNRINRILKESFAGTVWVRGIIASEIKNYKWYSYFDLKDEHEESSIYFKVELNRKNLETIEKKLIETGVADRMEKDLPVFCRVEVKIPTSNLVDIRLNMTDILPEYTRSKIKNQREITVEKLKEEKIFLNQKKLILPKLLTKIALITSEQGTSIKDIMAGLYPYNDKYDFYFLDSRMEGGNAVESMIRSIEFIEKFDKIKFDAVLIARGGGSEQSLSVFNDYALCKKICELKLPVITAIGHEKDLSAIELCSHITPLPSTPSGVGKFLNQRFCNIQNDLSEKISALFSLFNMIRKSELEKVYSFLRHIPVITGNLIAMKKELLVFRTKKYGDYILASIRENVMVLEKIRTVAERIFSDARKKLVVSEKEILLKKEIIEANDPEEVLKKGFTLTIDSDNRVIPSIKQFRKKDIKFLRFFDGSAEIFEREKK